MNHSNLKQKRPDIKSLCFEMDNNVWVETIEKPPSTSIIMSQVVPNSAVLSNEQDYW